MIRQLVIVLAAFALSWYAINVPARQLQITKIVSGGRIKETQNESSKFVAGFPWKYSEFTHDFSKPISDRRSRQYGFRSNANLCWNVALGIGIATILAGLVVASSRKQKKRLSNGSGGGGMQISLAGLLAIVTIVAGTFGYYRMAHQRKTDDLNAFSSGICRAQTMAPKWLGDIIDLSFLVKIERGTIDRADCTDAEFKRISKMRSLTSFGIIHADTPDIEAIASLPNLRTLSISECTLTGSMIDAVSNSSISDLTLRLLTAPPTTEQLGVLVQKTRDRLHSLTLPVFPDVPLQLSDLPQLRRLRLESATGEPLRVYPPLRRITQISKGLPPEIEQELLERLGVSATLDPETGDKEVSDVDVDVENMSVSLHDLTNLQNLDVAVPLSDLTIRNSSALPRLFVHKVSQRLELENLPSLRRLELGGSQFPKEVKLQDLPALIEEGQTPDRTFAFLTSGITFNGLWTESMVRNLGEYAAAITDTSSITMKALVAWLPHSRVKHLRFGDDSTNSIAIHPELELDADFDLITKPLPTIESITAARYFGDEGQTFPPQLLSKMPNLRELRLNNSFTDAHMKYLSGLTKLEILDAMTTQLTDEGWSKLPRMPEIRAVGVPHKVTRLTVKNLPKLQRLAYGGATLKSFELENLPSLKTWLRIDNRSQLERVRIKNVRDVALEMYRLPDEFELAGNASDVLAKGEWLNDETLLKVVSAATTQLAIADTSITAKSVDFLLTLADLEYLDVTNTALRDAEIKKLINEGNLGTIEANVLDLSPEINDSLPNAGLPPSQAAVKAYERRSGSFVVPTLEDLKRFDEQQKTP